MNITFDCKNAILKPNSSFKQFMSITLEGVDCEEIVAELVSNSSIDSVLNYFTDEQINNHLKTRSND